MVRPENIRVVVRARPRNETELAAGEVQSIAASSNGQQVQVTYFCTNSWPFTSLFQP